MSVLTHTFLDQCCLPLEGAHERCKSLHQAFVEWCDFIPCKPTGYRRFLSALRRHYRFLGPPYTVHGLHLKDEDDWEYCQIEDVRHVYLITDSRSFKIGMSIDPHRRLKNLQTGSSLPLHLLASYPGGQALEDELHRLYRGSHERGEWYQLTTAQYTDVITRLGGSLA